MKFKVILFLVLLCAVSVILAQSSGESVKIIAGGTTEEQIGFFTKIINFYEGSGEDLIGYCDPPSTGMLSGLATWMPSIIASAIISIVIAVFLYFVRIIFNDPQTNALAKKETYQVIANIFLIFFIIFLLSFVNDAIANAIHVAHGSKGDVFTVQQAACYYCLNVRDSMILEYSMATMMRGFLDTASSLDLPNIPSTLVFFDLSLNKFYMVLSSLIDTMLKVYGWGIAEWIVKVPLVQFFSTTMITVFMPLGLILRNFPGTRKAGGGIVALALAFYFVYPAMLYINGLMLSEFMNIDFYRVIQYGRSPFARLGILNFLQYALPFRVFLNTVPFIRNLTMPPFANPILIYTISSFMSSILIVFTTHLALSATKLWLLSSVIAPVATAMISLSFFFKIVQEFIAQIGTMLLLASIVLPLFNISVTLTAASDMARFLGSDISFASLASLI